MMSLNEKYIRLVFSLLSITHHSHLLVMSLNEKHIRLFFIVKYHSPFASDDAEPKWKTYKISFFLLLNITHPQVSGRDEHKWKNT